MNAFTSFLLFFELPAADGGFGVWNEDSFFLEDEDCTGEGGEGLRRVSESTDANADTKE
jgi:hypothetical protein